VNSLVTIGAVTSREFCRDWLLWNIEKQTYRPLEVVLVDAAADFVADFEGGPMSRRSFASYEAVALAADYTLGNGIKWKVRYPARHSTCGELRNIVLEHATGDSLCWFDDDDWQHPERVAWMQEELSASSEPWAGWDRGWLWDLFSPRVVRIGGYPGYQRVVNAATLYRTDVARSIEYDAKPKASDGRWIVRLQERYKTHGLILTDSRVHALWTRNGMNTSPTWPPGGHVSKTALQALVGPHYWGDASDSRFLALTDAFRVARASRLPSP
jgi:glycosyltransferase involved in cell wall biosynthesis